MNIAPLDADPNAGEAWGGQQFSKVPNGRRQQAICVFLRPADYRDPVGIDTRLLPCPRRRIQDVLSDFGLSYVSTIGLHPTDNIVDEHHGVAGSLKLSGTFVVVVCAVVCSGTGALFV